ncbi:MAG: heavy metal translocating P-type ATPase metal-binding domain-containing protein [Ferruginibacter sp.]|nr:heavy metal translocating P-type ATPase metal-binding domain-containing protein [Ferruginibacter sp.]
MKAAAHKHLAPCYHCGDPCKEVVTDKDKNFCCEGCRQVYLLLNENDLCAYYNFDANPGLKAKGKFTGERFAYLDDEALIQKLVQFNSEAQTNVTFSLPQMHCSSCVYLLENLHRLEAGIIKSTVNFQRKEVFISFNPTLTSLRAVVSLLAFTGYEPAISLKDATSAVDEKNRLTSKRLNRAKIFRIGLAGFCFANIMMLSFPEYLSSGTVDASLSNAFTWLNFVLSLPVLFFCASGFFVSAWKSLRQNILNIDAPIVVAILVTFGRSYYEIISGQGAGYLDSGSGIIFFMLIGRWFQDKTFDALSFERDYRSYFPLGVSIITADTNVAGKTHEKNVPVTGLKQGDRIIMRNEELIPADSILVKGNAQIDYSFVNGENSTVHKVQGELVYAGGRQRGGAIELRVSKLVSQSYITQLWNNDIFNKPKQKKESFVHPWSRYFTLVLFSIAIATVIFWWFNNPGNIWPALTSVLIVACPCSLLLSHTFTNGNMLRILGNNKLYLRNAQVIESLAAIDCIVFDKTGTITRANQSHVQYTGLPLSATEKAGLQLLSSQSAHPLSKMIASELKNKVSYSPELREFREYPGKGISAFVENLSLKMGSANFMKAQVTQGIQQEGGSKVYVQVDEKIKGTFSFSNQYRTGIRKEIEALKNEGFDLHVLSGDNSAEKETLEFLFGPEARIFFRQLPEEKLQYIRHLQLNNKQVMMIGDGLNDAGALLQAQVGIAVSDNHAQFAPACDAIIDGEQVKNISRFLRFARAGKKIVTASFILSILYNLVGISFAVTAQLSPVVAAILMPASSISIVLFVTLAGNAVAKKQGLLSAARPDEDHTAF